MKKNMKKLLVIALALMPSLSISVMAQPSGDDPEVIPVKQVPLPSNPGPRIAPLDYDDIPLKPLPDPDPNPNPIPRLTSQGDEVIPIKPRPGDGGVPVPRVRSNEPDDIPIIPDPNSGGTLPRFRNSAQAPHCYHIGGVVYIDAATTVTYINATVTRYDDNQVWSNASNTNTLSITTSTDAGSYLLELTLSTGQSYKGKYIIE